MGSHFVVLASPIFHLSACIVEVQEPVLAEALQADDGVEALGVGVVRWSAWPAEVEDHAVGVGP